MRNSNYRKLLNLKLFCKPFALYTHETPEKGFEVMKIVKILGLEENWVELLAKLCFYRRTWTKCLARSKKTIKQSWTRPKN